jgi:S-formylglutathione hydrolase FrmB
MATVRGLSAALAALSLSAGAAAQAAPVTVRVDAGACGPGPVSGRMLVFAAKLTGELPKSVAISPFDPSAASVAAQEVRGLKPGAPVTVDADVMAYPEAFSRLAPGRYAVQAVLDQNHTYNYADRGAGDCVSDVAAVDLPSAEAATLVLKAAIPAVDPWRPRASDSAAVKQAFVDARPSIRELSFTSPSLTRFWGRPTPITGWIVLPPDYDERAAKRYPVVYQTHGFGGSHAGQLYTAVRAWGDMQSGAAPPMIWVMLDESSPTGTHEFADSVNNGPWGQALTEELIPRLEATYRMDAKPSGRFLTGHSSGGWAALWVQTRYPALFGGSWPTSPDPSDFHDWTGSDLYAPNANVYRRADGSAAPIMRMNGKVVATLEQFARLEEVIGPIGGKMASFDWVFSPKGPDGRPMPLFDRETGAVDPTVLAYWRDNYDVAFRLKRDWPSLRRDLDGKLHLTVGTADTFYLDGSARRLEAVMRGLGAKTDFRYVDGRTHFDLFRIDKDERGLIKQIAWEMYAVARPGAKRPAQP